MIYIEKSEEPEFLSEFNRKNPDKTYDSEEFAHYRGILTDVLIKEQKGICAYCCGRIKKENVHNEHIEPRNPGKYVSKRSLDYSNLVASCNTIRTCGRKKENKYDSDKFVSPLEQECEKKFTYYGNGTIVGDEYTINLLNLNDYELREARKAVYQQLQHLDKETIKLVYMNEQDEEYQPYYNVIKWYVNG